MGLRIDTFITGKSGQMREGSMRRKRLIDNALSFIYVRKDGIFLYPLPKFNPSFHRVCKYKKSKIRPFPASIPLLQYLSKKGLN